MARDLTSGQLNAAHRRDVYGVIYALTGTLQSLVSGIPDVTFYWSTKEMVSGGPVSGYSGGWEPYLTLPKDITEELPVRPGEVPPLHNIDVLVRNLPFNFAESLLTAIDDKVWQWEGTNATLYSAYQRKGQTAAEIPQGDWFPLRLNGQLGGPRDAKVDGFVLPLASREQVRRQQVDVREITSGDFPNADPREYGKVLATVYGAPDSWIRGRRTDAGIFGLVTDAVVSGTQDYVRVVNDAGFDMSDLVGREVYLHRGDYIDTVSSVEGDDESVLIVHFANTISINVPQGAVIQERKTPAYQFALLNQLGDDGIDMSIRAVGLELLDGRIIPLDTGSWTVSSVDDANGAGALGSPSLFPSRVDILILDSVQPPVIIPRLNLPSEVAEVSQQPEATVTQQPSFATDQVMTATKDNWPTGPGIASAAYDGNKNTSYVVGVGSSVTFTFPSVTGGFSNSDTIVSTLKFTSAGKMTVTDGLTTTFANVTGSKGDYTIHLGAAEEFNQSVKFIGDADGAGGQVYEVQWTHELERSIDIDRTDDTELITSDVIITGTGEVGFDMLPIRGLVAKVNTAYNTFDEKALPNRVFEDIQMRFLGESLTDQSWKNSSTYDAAEERYLAERIALHFAVDRQFTWSELEADLALASKSYAFYGPEGHELHYIESADDLAEVSPVAEFRLPGTPNPNAVQAAGSPLMERTPLSQLVNTVRIYHSRNWLLSRSEDLEERYDSYVEASNARAVALFGQRIDGAAPVLAWPISKGANFVLIPDWGSGGYSGDTHAEKIAQYLADRYASGTTRFTFDTAGGVVGVQRGDIVRVIYATAPRVYRNVQCEVEVVQQVPNNVNRYRLTCRSIGTPQKGLTSNLRWTDLFTLDTDSWSYRITGKYDRWEQYFGTA